MNFTINAMLTWAVPSSFGNETDFNGGNFEERFGFKSLGGNHIPQFVDDFFTFHGHLHFHDRVEQQVAAVLARGAAQVIHGAVGKKFHRHQPAIGIGKQAFDLREVGDLLAIEIRLAAWLIDSYKAWVHSPIEPKPRLNLQ